MIDIEYKTVQSVYGPLVVVDKIGNAAYNEIVKVKLSNGEQRLGQVLETSTKFAIVQLFGTTSNINASNTSVSFTGETFQIGVSEDMLGRIFDGQGRPRDINAQVIAEEKRDINGEPMNPAARALPNDFIETGISTIDGLMTLVRGQKLPIFSGSGLPHNELAAQIAMQSAVRNTNDSFAVVFAGIGLTNYDASFFMNYFRRKGAMRRSVAFINLAEDPSVERILTPRIALTTAEYLAYEKHMHVLVIMSDMTNYAEAMREMSSAREEVPGRRGYPGYMYTDLASLYERAGIVSNNKGSITQLDILTMPGDDVTHPIPDLTGYITEGQINLGRALYNKHIYPPINPIGSLSRLRSLGIGKGKTREDHGNLADQLYGAYAKALEASSLSSIVGKEALSDTDRMYLKFGEDFEGRFISQGRDERRDIEKTLEIGWDLVSALPERELSRIKPEYIEKYYKGNKQDKHMVPEKE